MEMKIYIPSRSRAHLWATNVWSKIPDDIPVNIVVPNDEVSKYLAAGERHLRQNTRILGTASKGIAATREWIGKNAAQAGASRFVMLDDDLRFARRKDFDDPKQWQLTNCNDDDTREMFRYVDELLQGKYAAAGISMRMSNNRKDVFTEENARLVRFLAFQTEPFNECIHNRVPVMEDFDVLLQLLERGLPNVCVYKYAQDQSYTQKGGGCSDYRTHEMQEQAANMMAELHPGIVSTKIKRSKAADRAAGSKQATDFAERTDVTIQWKKAYEQGLQRRAA